MAGHISDGFPAVSPQPEVHVMQLQHKDVGYTSVHRSRLGAERKLYEIASLWGIAPSALHTTADVTYGISKLPVED